MSRDFRINKAYAEKYNNFRQKEEYQKLRDRYGNIDEDESSSSSESEDENAEALTEQIEKDWLRTLAALKSKDPKIYQKDVKFYHDESDDSSNDNKSQKKKKKDKPMFLKDYDRKVILEKGGIIDEDSGSGNEEGPSSLGDKLGYYEEQEKLRKSLAAAVQGSDEDSEGEDFLTERKKTKEEVAREEAEHVEWLKGQKDSLEKEKEVGIELAPLKKYWEKPDLDDGEKFLKNFILNKQYIDNDEDGIPTYSEVVDGEEDFSEEEELLIKQETFERKYNFRFEEPEAAEVKTFPRTMEDSLRRKDTKRAEKRKEVKERKLKEKERKKEDIKQLKKMKRQEIMDKIEKLKHITGNQSLGISEEDLEDDFDPKKHDEMMQKYFDEDYYGVDEGDTKPMFDMSDEELQAENWDGWTGDAGAAGGGEEDWKGEGPYADDPDFNMDADFDPEAERERKKQKKKKKNKLAQALSSKKPVFDPTEKTFEEYFDEYYKLDYEDIIDDMPCRFKYRKVKPNTYGLSTDEILKARDKELNAWVSLKKMSQYRPEDEEEKEVRVYESKGKNVRRKQNVLPSIFESEKQDETEEGSEKKKNKKKKKKKQPDTVDSVSDQVEDDTVNSRVSQGPEENTVDSGGDVKNKKGTSGKRKHDINEVDSNKKLKTDKNDVHSSPKKKKKNKEKEQLSEQKVTEGIESANVDGNDEMEVSGFEKGEEKLLSNSAEGGSGDLGKKKRKKKKKANKEDQKLKLSDERLKAYGINPKKYKYMQKEELFQIKPRKEKVKKEETE